MDVMLWRTDGCRRVGLGSLVTRDGRVPAHRCLGCHVVVGFYRTRQRPVGYQSYAMYVMHALHTDKQKLKVMLHNGESGGVPEEA
jgi:hypothetical protein